MGKRATIIALFDEQSLSKFKYVTDKVNSPLCKVPYREENREELDTLPYHFTFCVWDAQDRDKAIEVFKEINCKEIILNIIGLSIKESYNNSWNLYFDMEPNDELYSLQKEIYSKSRVEKYNPDTFIPHITIHCDRNYNKILDLKKKLDKDFVPFKVKFNKIGLFEIYPAKRIEI